MTKMRDVVPIVFPQVKINGNEPIMIIQGDVEKDPVNTA
jgi:hypothetical protein